jgi:hypothetical protein
MKFYLTKAAQRAAESGQVPAKKEKVARAPKVMAEKAPKVARVHAEKVPSARRQRAAVASAPAPVADSKAPASPVVAPLAPSFAATPTPEVPTSAPATVAAPTRMVETPTLSSVEAAPARGRGAKASKSVSAPQAAPVAKEKKGVIAIGGQPRVDLLPDEVRAERRAAHNVRRVWLGVAAAAVLVAIATGASTLYAKSANDELTSVQAQTGGLTQQASKYSAVRTTQSQVDLIKAAQLVGGSTDVDWTKYLSSVALTLPSGVSVTSLSVVNASPVMAVAEPTTPLQGQRVATLSFQITSNNLPAITTWLNNLATLKGYVDASAGNVASGTTGYTGNVTLHINQKVFSNIYAKGN